MTCTFVRTMAKMAWYWMVKVNRRRSERRAELARAIPSEEEEDEVKGLVRFQDWHCSQQTCRLLMIAWREWVGWQDWYSCHPLLVSNADVVLCYVHSVFLWQFNLYSCAIIALRVRESHTLRHCGLHARNSEFSFYFSHTLEWEIGIARENATDILRCHTKFVGDVWTTSWRHFASSVKVEGCSLLCASKKSKVFCFIVNPPRNNQYYFIDGIATTVHPSLYICLYKQVIEGDFRLHYTRVHVALDTKRGNESKLKTLCAFKSWHKRNATLNSAKFY